MRLTRSLRPWRKVVQAAQHPTLRFRLLRLICGHVVERGMPLGYELAPHQKVRCELCAPHFRVDLDALERELRP